MRILVVEDEPALAEVIASRLKDEKYSVDISYDGEEGAYNALTGIYNLIILDVMLPYKNGFDILKKIKENNIDSKIIMLTAKSELEDKLNGLENGADDYVTKPFHIEELLARVNIQLRKKGVSVDGSLCFNDLKLSLKKSNLLCVNTNENIDVSMKELLMVIIVLKK